MGLIRVTVKFNFMLLAIEWTNIRYFLLGLATGFVLFGLMIGFIFIIDRKKQTKIYRSKETPLMEEAVQQMIENKQNQLVDTARIADNAYFRVAYELSEELMSEIAKYYFPDSKYPIYELSIEELLSLSYYITARLEKIVNRRFVRNFKNYRISTIINLINKKKAIENSKLMKLSKQMKVSKLLSFGKTVLNYANPVFWFRKLAIKPSVTLLTKEACKLIIEIVGEETNKLYSKKMFETPEDVDRVEIEFDEKLADEVNQMDVTEGSEEDVIQTKKKR